MKKLTSTLNFFNPKFYVLTLFLATVLITIVFYTFLSDSTIVAPLFREESFIREEEIIDFEGFDNENGLDFNIVPNIVHLIYLQETNIKFYQVINIFAIYLNHKPDFIYIHCDDCAFYGKYYEKLKSFQELWNIIKIKKIPYKDTIFGVKYGWINHHRSDTWRLQILMNYGGIFLDNDVYIIKPLNKYLKYEMTVSWDNDNHGLGKYYLY